MSDLSLFITNLEAKSKQLETNIAQSLASHHSLLGYTQAINEILSIASPLVSALFPAVDPEVDAINSAVSQVTAAADSIVFAPLKTEA